MRRYLIMLVLPVVLAGCSDQKKQDVSFEAESPSSEAVTQTETKETPETTEAPAEKKDSRVDIKAVTEAVRDLHSFTTADYAYYDGIESRLKEAGVRFDRDYSTPYREVYLDRWHPRLMRAGVIDDMKVSGADSLHPVIEVRTRTLTTQIVDASDLPALGSKVQMNLRRNEAYQGNVQTVRYQLDLSEDRKTGVLKRTTKWDYRSTP